MTKDANNRIIKNTIALYCRTAITMIVSFLTVRITLKVLGVEDYGLNNVVGSIAAMFSFLNLSMGTAVQRFFSYEIGKNNQENLKMIFGVGIYLHSLVALITFIVGEIFAFGFLNLLNIPPERLDVAMIVFQISLISMTIGIITVPYGSLLRAREEFSKYAILDVGQSFLRLAVLFLLYTIDYEKLIVLSVCNFIVSMLYIVGTIYYAKKYKEAVFHYNRDKATIKQMLSFISWLLVTVLLSLGRDNGLILLINLFFGLTINAAYGIAAQVMNMVNNFSSSFKQSVVPQLMSSYSSGDYERMKKLLYSGTKITFILLMCITMPVIFEPYAILNILLDEVPQYAPEFTKLVLININISSFTYFLYQGVHATGKIKMQQFAMSSIYILNLIGVYATFKLGFSFYSAIYVTIICSTLQCFLNMYYANRTFGLNILDFTKSVVLPSIILCTIISIPAYLVSNLMNQSITRIIAVALIILISITVGGYYVYMNDYERNICRKILLKFRRN